MTRAPFQVLVFPYRTLESGEIAYAVFRRRDDGMSWQAISGGGEDNETPLEAARRPGGKRARRRASLPATGTWSWSRVPPFP